MLRWLHADLDRYGADACAATYVKGLACNETVGGIGKKHDGPGNVIGAAQPFYRNALRDGVLALAARVDNVVEHVGLDRPRGDHVDRDAFRGKVQRPGAGHADPAAFVCT